MGVRRQGNRVEIGYPLSPCFTGIRNAAGAYVGGGYTQGGSYVRTSARVTVKGNNITVTMKSPPVALKSQRASKAQARKVLRQSYHHSGSLGGLFIDCTLK